MSDERPAPDPLKRQTWKAYLKETMKEFGKALSEVVGGGKE